MKEGTASYTARSVAARRLSYDRVAAPYGDPAADDALSRDVAAGMAPRPTPMHEYIRARTAFFDHAVVDAIARDITQVVIGGAGYDGRALRYARPGVRWFEVDHPATQADKRERLSRLGLDVAHIRFIPADFTTDPIAGPLRSAGLDPARPALFLFEGVAVYLEAAVTERVLAGFRAVTTDAGLLAISISVGAATSQARARFRERVAEMGEPARTTLSFGQASDLLAAAGWEVTQPSERQRSAGLLLARAATAGRRERTSVTPAGGSGRPPATAAPDTERTRLTPGPPAASPAGRAAASPPASPPPADLPLSALLSQALVAFTIEADNEAEYRIAHRTTSHGLAPGAARGAPWLTSLLMWANCLRFLPDAGITVGELRDRARTGTNLDGMRRWRYVTYTPDPGPGKRPGPAAIITPTPSGIAARDIWQQVTADVEAHWRRRLGGGPFDALRSALTGLVGQLDPALPDCLPILGPGLVSGRDLRPAADPRSPGTLAPPPFRAAGLPLWALLSRPLLAFALQYEREPGPSLAISADILRVLTEAGVPVKEIPARGGVSKESVAIALGTLSKSGLVTEGPDPGGSRFRYARLTRSGALARDEYPVLAADIEADWRVRFGDDTITVLRQALEPLAAGDPAPLLAGLAPHPGNWRAHAKPLQVLPHYPMTLHRGGYPDGS